MIIPQIASNITMSGNVVIPDKCPACGEATKIKTTNDIEALYCTNPKCPAKEIKNMHIL